ncbi:MAG: hypothetical protein GEV10_21440 [Streptosporangiales bacterium]|nr:hypothetical protein [Streptosporangiales bacterium]
MLSTVDPTRIPLFEGDLAGIEVAAARFRKAGSRCITAGVSVDTRFQGLAGCYRAPERWELLASTAPVRLGAAGFGSDLKSVGDALADYAAEMRPVVAALSRLFDRALAFTVSVSGDGGWDRDKVAVETNNSLIRQVSAQAEAKAAIERRCANRIEALVGGRVWHAADRRGDPRFGYGSADIPDNAATPWGAPADWQAPWDHGVLGAVADFYQGVWVDGVWGTVVGLNTLTPNGIYSAAAAALLGRGTWASVGQAAKTTGTAWTGLGKAAAGMVLYTNMLVAPFVYASHATGTTPRWVRSAGRSALDMGKGMLAWDTWRTDPARAAGATAFNLTTFFLPGGEATGVLNATRATRVGAAETGLLGRLLGHTDDGPLPHLPDSVADRSLDVPRPDPVASGGGLPHLHDPVGDRLPGRTPSGVAAAEHGEYGSRGHGIDDPEVPRRDLPDDDRSSTEGVPDENDGPTSGHGDGSGSRGISTNEIPPPRTAEDGQAMPTTEMEQVFVEADRAEGVTYLSQSELEGTRLVVRGGKLHDMSGKLFDTSQGTSVWARGDTRAIFVMDRHGNIYASNDHAVGRFHHSSFLGGRPVAGAGELRVEEGVLKIISDKSGHYRPPPECMRRVAEVLKAAGVDFEGVEFDSWGS